MQEAMTKYTNDYKVGKYCISSVCLNTIPCKHNVTIDGKTTCMASSDIYHLYESHGVRVPDHFASSHPMLIMN